ncbi:hypothetical protein [Shimazuella kribbensis]|nr:hypothetical protein [Shimazuella kribbensis]
MLDKGNRPEITTGIEISETDMHHIVVVKSIFEVHISETRHTFAKVGDG